MSVAKQMVHHSLVASSHKTEGGGKRPLKMIVSISEKICISIMENGQQEAKNEKLMPKTAHLICYYLVNILAYF